MGIEAGAVHTIERPAPYILYRALLRIEAGAARNNASIHLQILKSPLYSEFYIVNILGH